MLLDISLNKKLKTNIKTCIILEIPDLYKNDAKIIKNNILKCKALLFIFKLKRFTF